VTWPRLFKKVTALGQALLMLSLTACGTAAVKKTDPSSNYRVSATSEAAATPPSAATAKSEAAAQPPVTPSPAPPKVAAEPPVQPPSPPAASTPPAPPAGTPPAPAPPTPPAPERGPAVRLRQAQSQPAPGQPPPQPGAPAPGRLVVFNFDNADLEIVLQATSELVVFNYVLAPEVRGKKVTVQTTGRIPVEDIFPVLLTILDVNGLAAVKSGSVYRIIAKQGAPQTPTLTVVGDQIEASVPGDQVVTLITPLKFVSAADAVNLLRPFVPAQGALNANRDTNLLVIIDVAANVRRLLDILKLVDVDVASSELQIIQLKHADAQEVAQILTQLFASGRFRAGTGQVGAAITPPPVPTAAPTPTVPRPVTPAAGPGQDAGSSAERAPLIVPERRSNSLIIYARKQELDTIRRLIEKLDADVYGGQRIFFYFCENTKARDLAATMDAIFGRGSGSSPQQTQPSSSLGGSTTAPRTPGLPSQPLIQPSARPTTTGGPGGGRLEGLLGEGGAVGAETRFIPDEVTNSIIVTTYPRTWAEIEPIIKRLDRMPRQVLIEVLVAEITLDDATSLGMEWAIREGKFNLFYTGNPPNGPDIINRPNLPDFIKLGSSVLAPGLSFFAFSADQFLAAIRALASLDRVNILSSPSVITTENKKAVINVSKSVPVLTSQQSTVGGTVSTTPLTNTAVIGTQTVEYKDVGIVLTVTPRIGEEGTVALDVKQEVNDILSLQTGQLASPTFSKREAETSVVLLNNQTLVLGGLIQTKKEFIKRGVPFLSEVPVLGYLFRNTTENVTKTELLMLITPRVVGTALDASRITDQMRRLTPELKESIRDKEFPYPSFEFMKP
jgi:general secretion pathway protein D